MYENGIGFQNVDIKKCRLCLGYEKFLIYLYEASGMSKNVAKAISELLHYKVSEMDGFPPYICTACSDKLWEFKAFKFKCDSAFEILLKEKERRTVTTSSYINAIAVKEEPVLNDSTSSQCNRDPASTELQVFVESISVKQDEPISCSANHFPEILRALQYKIPEGVPQPKESTNAQLYQSESLNSDMVLNSRDFIPYSNKQEDKEVVTSKTSHIKTTFNLEIQNENIYPEEVGIVARDDAILNDNIIGSLQSLIDKISPSEIGSEELGDKIIVLRKYGVRKSGRVVLSSDTKTELEGESVEISYLHEDLINETTTGDDVTMDTCRFEGNTPEDLFLESFLSADHIPGLEHIHKVLKNSICEKIIYGSSNPQLRESDDLEDYLQSTGNHQLQRKTLPHSSLDEICKFKVEGTNFYENWLEGFLSLVDVKQSGSLPDEMRKAKKMRTSSNNNRVYIEMEEENKEIDPPNSNNVGPHPHEFRDNYLALDESEKLLDKCGSKGESLLPDKNDRKCQKDEDLEKDEEKVKEQQRSKSIHKHSSVIGVTSVGGLSEHILDESTNESSTNEEMFEKSELSKEEKQKKQVSGFNSFLCELCGKVFYTKMSIRTHLNAVHVERKLSCLKCDKQFKTRHQLDQHSKTHSDIRPFICTLCNKQFRFKHHLRQHINSHTGKKMYSCSHCDMGFITMYKLHAHQSSHDNEKQWCCTICREMSHTWEEHLAHTEKHTHGRRFSCATCGRNYKYKNDLRKHIIGHYRPYKCEICSKSFGRTNTLKSHILTHTKKKAYVCTICSEGFNRRHELQMHLQIHTGEKLLHCQLCEWYSTDERRLKAHVKMTHSESKTKLCSYCGLTFPNRYQRDKHKRLHFNSKIIAG